MRRGRAVSAAACAAGLVLLAAQVQGQGAGLDTAPREARAFVARAVEAMGGQARLKQLHAALLVAEGGAITERHTLLLPARFMHYASRRRSGAGFDVVLGKDSFICDRNRSGQVTYVEDLSEADAGEGAYERDVLFMPLLLLQLLNDPGARLDYRGPNSVGDPVVRAAVRVPRGTPGKPFWIRLRFDKRTSLLVQSMGLVPIGADKGKKRYFAYQDYEQVRGVRLPTHYVDHRGEGEPRDYQVSWQLDPELDPGLFSRPEPAGDR